jgi:prevent-host-death family protein
MLQAGIRELRQRASELVRLVERGEIIEITDRGRPVALLSPLPGGSPYQRRLAEGEVIRATRDLDDLPDPLPLLPGQESSSSVLARLRADER